MTEIWHLAFIIRSGKWQICAIPISAVRWHDRAGGRPTQAFLLSM
jgi:hypothetical protein